MNRSCECPDGRRARCFWQVKQLRIITVSGSWRVNGADGRTVQVSLFLASRTCLKNGDGIWLRAVQVLAWEEASIRERYLSDAEPVCGCSHHRCWGEWRPRTSYGHAGNCQVGDSARKLLNSSRLCSRASCGIQLTFLTFHLCLVAGVIWKTASVRICKSGLGSITV